MKNIQIEAPNLNIENLKIWIHGYQFPDASDYWDGNWLNVTAQYRSAGSLVEVSGHIIHLREVVGFMNNCEEALQGLVTVIELATIEPNLRVKLELDKLGHIKGALEITPNHMSEQHEYVIDLDQSYLPAIVAQCKNILKEYPVKNEKSEN